MFDEVLHPAFEKEIVNIDVKNIVYSKDINAHLLNSRKFKVIVSSIEEIGIIEPPVVTCKNGRYLLLDGHLRISALKKLNISQVSCLLSTDDEAFTYNKHVNRLTNIQEHRMIKKLLSVEFP